MIMLNVHTGNREHLRKKAEYCLFRKAAAFRPISHKPVYGSPRVDVRFGDSTANLDAASPRFQICTPISEAGPGLDEWFGL